MHGGGWGAPGSGVRMGSGPPEAGGCISVPLKSSHTASPPEDYFIRLNLWDGLLGESSGSVARGAGPQTGH